MFNAMIEFLTSKVPTRIVLAMQLAVVLVAGIGAYRGFKTAHELEAAPCRYATKAPRYAEEMSEILCKDLGVSSQSQPASP